MGSLGEEGSRTLGVRKRQAESQKSQTHQNTLPAWVSPRARSEGQSEPVHPALPQEGSSTSAPFSLSLPGRGREPGAHGGLEGGDGAQGGHSWLSQS